MPDLTDIPGITDLWTRTLGNPQITVAVLDGPADFDRACFREAHLTQIKPYWQEDLEVPQEYIDLYIELENKEEDSQEKASKIESAIPSPFGDYLNFVSHATHIASTIFGQHHSPVEGLAPHCRGINIPLGYDFDNFSSPLNLSRAINLALNAGANIIHIAVCIPTQTGVAHDLLERAVRQCQDNNILIIAPGGNNEGECWCIPAVLPHVLTVGAMKDNGQPFKFSNWGGQYQNQGVLAPGENILGAQPWLDKPVRKKGTSCAAPIVTGVAALLLSLQLQQGEPPDVEAVRTAILESAIPCDPEEVEEPERCLLGKLNVPGALELLAKKPLLDFEPRQSTEQPATRHIIEKVVTNSASIIETLLSSLENSAIPDDNRSTAITPSQSADAINPSARSNLVYSLGTLGYDLGSEARRDTFKQLMPWVEIPDAPLVPPDPYDARQMADYLAAVPSEAKSLIWTLSLESGATPLYAIEPVGPFADEVYELLQALLAGEVLPENSDGYIERVSIPGRLTGKTVELFSGEVVPVIQPDSERGIYGWNVNAIIDAALEAVPESEQEELRVILSSFLSRIYYDFRNLGQVARDRALNFAATNIIQSVSIFSQQLLSGMELDHITVAKSPYCRPDSDCWDIVLKFFDPDNSDRAKKVYRYTIDVCDIFPVTLGEAKPWSEAPN
jgi:subtilisin family serine protease